METQDADRKWRWLIGSSGKKSDLILPIIFIGIPAVLFGVTILTFSLFNFFNPPQKPVPLTPEQVAAQTALDAKAQERKDAEEKKAKAKEEADLQAYYATPGGKVCKTHPTWSKDDCERIVANKVWIGMGYDMLLYVRGKPDNANVSNYGRGNEYQYCWYSYTPSCFYDKNDDGLLDAFN